VQDEMDLRLLDRLRTVDWSASRCVLDLACGTGRVGAWLAGRCSAAIDGVDITPEMLAVARRRDLYRTLRVADVLDTGLAAEAYDLCTQSLADEHLPDLRPLYREVARLTRQKGYFVLVGFHPYFLMAGMPTHFERAPGEHVTIRSYVHLLSDHVKAAHAAGWSLRELEEGLIDEAWVRKKPKWQVYFGLPVSFALVWQRQ
jgi:SAM-dependent methyltransferase